MASDVSLSSVFAERIAQIRTDFSAAEGGGIAFREVGSAAWEDVLAQIHYVPVNYSSASMDYQLAYQRGHGGHWADLSMILFHDNRPCGVWPLSFSIKDGGALVTSQGLPLLPPLFVRNFAIRSRKSAVQRCLRLWDLISVPAGIENRSSADSFAAATESGLSTWSEQLLRAGAQVRIRCELFVDLSLELEAIKSRFRKSYKSLITSGAKEWQVGELTDADLPRWQEFRDLHRQVSGRVTRSEETWDLQHRAIADGKAFLVFLCNADGKMVGGGFFNITRDEGVYSVGAYDRSLFEKPLGHVVQYRAIEIMKSLNLRWYKIGLRPYPSDLPPPNEKDLSIAEFKQGFATHLFPQFILSHDRQTVCT